MGGHIQKSIATGDRIEKAHPRGFDIHPEQNPFLGQPMGAFRQASLRIENTTDVHHFGGSRKPWPKIFHQFVWI
jgi:hypothetical protein